MKKTILLFMLTISLGMKSQNNYEFTAISEGHWWVLNVWYGGDETRFPVVIYRDTTGEIHFCDTADYSRAKVVLFRKGILPVTDTCSTDTGTVVFYLTDDGTNTGNAIYPNGNIFPQFTINDNSRIYAYSWVLSNSNRTLTVSVKYQDHDLVSGLFMTPATNGRRVRMTITGN